MFNCVGVPITLTKFGTPLYNKRCNLELPLLPTHVVLDLMDPIIGRMLSQKEVDCFNKSVREAIKCIGSSLGVEDDDSNNDIFYTPLSNPLEPIFVELQNCLDVDRGRRHSCILLDYHLKICDHVLYHEPSWPRCPPHVKLEQMEKGHNKSSHIDMPFVGGICGKQWSSTHLLMHHLPHRYEGFPLKDFPSSLL